VKYHIADGDQQRGPYTLDELWRVDFAPDTLVWHDGLSDWQRADSIADLRTVLAGKVPELEPVDPPQDPADDGSGELDIKIPTDVKPVERVTVFPGAYEPQFQSGQSIGYAGGGGAGYAYGALPIGAAVTSLVLGILALVLSVFSLCLWVISGPLAIAAIVVGHIARNNANRGTAAGGGMALAGLICGYIALALTAFFRIGFLGLMAAG
jgi:hypothetical protein